MKNELPKWFPPGYFDKWFWGIAALNVFNLVLNVFLACTASNDTVLLVNCGAVALVSMTWYVFLRRLYRDSKRWRLEDREKTHQRILKMVQAHHELMQEIEPIMRKHAERFERDND
jgi:hypothetical protein